MSARIRDVPWEATALGAAVFAALHFAAQAAAARLGAPGGASAVRSIPLALVLGALLAVALTFVVAADKRVRSTGRAMRRAALFCIVPSAAVAGAAASGEIATARAVLGIAALVAGSLFTAWLIAARARTGG